MLCISHQMEIRSRPVVTMEPYGSGTWNCIDAASIEAVRTGLPLRQFPPIVAGLPLSGADGRREIRDIETGAVQMTSGGGVIMGIAILA